MKIGAVLVVDDNASLRRAMKSALEAAGYRVWLAANGNDALELQEEHHADVLVTDIFMPEADGFETIERFRASFPGVPIVAISGDAQRAKGDYLSVAAMMGVEATLPKPFRMETLLQTLHSLES
jgi:CheY-like chemotaxis protein